MTRDEKGEQIRDVEPRTANQTCLWGSDTACWRVMGWPANSWKTLGGFLQRIGGIAPELTRGDICLPDGVWVIDWRLLTIMEASVSFTINPGRLLRNMVANLSD
jgi:hypothetical protein